MSILKPQVNYMNPETGSVDTGKAWMEDQEHLGFPISDLNKLIEVVKKNDHWEGI